MILAAIFAANCLLPPGPYIAPRQRIAIEFTSAEVVHDIAGWRGLRNEWRGVEWGFNTEGRRGLAYLATGDSESQSCSLRHALGHFSDYERTGNSNPRHIGWEYQE